MLLNYKANDNETYSGRFTSPVLPNQPHPIYGDSHLKRYKLLHHLFKSEPSSQLSIASNSSVNSPKSPLSNYSSKLKPGFLESSLVSDNLNNGNVSENLSILFEASKSGDLDKFKATLRFLRLCYKGSFSLNSKAFPLGSTPIHIAALEGNFGIVEYILLEKLFEVDVQDINLETPLMNCCKYGHLKIAQLLINYGAEVNEVDLQGWSALHNASANGHLNLVSLLVEEGKAWVDSQSCRGFTPLMDASARGFPDVVKYLVSQRYCPCDPTLENNLGETAYAIAACCENVFLCDILEEAENLVLNKSSSLKKRPNAYIISVYENQSYTSKGKLKALWSSNNKFIPAHLVDGHPHFTYRGSHNEAKFSSILLPSEDGWLWQTDWKLCKDIPGVNLDTGWQYSNSFDSHDLCWTPVPPFNQDVCVRRRRWYRVARRTIDLA